MPRLDSNDLRLTLEVVQRWNQCETVEELVKELKASLLAAGDFEVRAKAQRPGDAPSGSSAGRSKFPRTLTRKVSDKNEYTVSIISSESVELWFLVRKSEGALSVRARDLLDEFSMHLAPVFEQVCRLEDLQAKVGGLEAMAPVELEKDTVLFDFSKLTKRETEAVELLKRGLSNGDIASRMGISRRTVEKHFEAIYQKLGVENRYQLLSELSR